MTEKEKEQICRWWHNHELTGFRKTFSGKTYPSTADMQEFGWFIDSLEEEPKPKFRKGDKIQTVGKSTGHIYTFTITEIQDDYYVLDDDKVLTFNMQDNWELVEEPVSKDLEEACEQLAENARKHKAETSSPFFSPTDYKQGVKDGAKWQKNHLWKPADGDTLPDIDREVIALLDNCKVVFAHRPPEYWDGKDIVTGKVTRNYPKTYDKCGWNIQNIKYWLDVELPKEIEL